MLYLHGNLVRRTNGLEALAKSKCLRVMSLHNNPIASDEFYRSSVFRAIPTLIALDGHPKIPHDNFLNASASSEGILDPELVALARKMVKPAVQAVVVTTMHSDPLQGHLKELRGRQQLSLEEFEREFKMKILKARDLRDSNNRDLFVGWALRRFLVRCSLSLPIAYRTLSSTALPDRFRHVQDELIATAHRLYSFCNPALVVQRCMRGHFGRKLFRKCRIQFIIPTVALQRWLRRQRMNSGFMVQGYRSEECRVTDQQKNPGSPEADRILGTLPRSSDGRVYSNLAGASDLYFLPDDVVRVRLLLRTVENIFSIGKLPTLEVSNLTLHRAGPGSIAHLIPFFHVVIKREYRERPISKAHIFLRHSVDSKSSLSLLSRRGMSCTKAEKQAVAEAYAVQRTPSTKHASARVTFGSCSLNRRYLLLLRFSSQHARGLFIRVLNNMNKGNINNSIRYLLQELVARMCAACSIQSAARSWLQRRKMHPSLCTAVFAMRAIRLIQRWWRWKVLSFRIECLSLVRQAVLTNGETAVLYCFANDMKPRFEEDSAGRSFFREARFHFDFDADEHVFVHRADAEGTRTADPVPRPFLPHWIAVGVQHVDKNGSNDPPSCSSGHDIDILQGNPRELKTLLQTGCQATLENTKGGAMWGAESSSWRLPNRPLMGGSPVLRLKFSSALEARRRMCILLIRTFRPSHRRPLRLLSAEIAAKNVFAMFIQAVFRGWLTRRWWHLITSFLRRQLATSFLEERAKVSLQEAPAEGALMGNLPAHLQQVLRKLKLSEKALSNAVWHQQMLSDRVPKVRLSRDQGQQFKVPNVENAPELQVRPPTRGVPGYGGGLPGDVISGKDKKVFAENVRVENCNLNEER